MKVSTNLKYALSALVLFLVNIALYAQERKVDVDIDLNKNEAQWYNNPVVWVIGGAVFILLLVALLRGGKSKG
jgi:cell division protein FtsW (lipid II flippase)